MGESATIGVDWLLFGVQVSGLIPIIRLHETTLGAAGPRGGRARWSDEVYRDTPPAPD